MADDMEKQEVASEELVLTPREIAIARGEDPDAVQDTAGEAQDGQAGAADTVQDAASAQNSDSAGGVVAGEEAGAGAGEPAGGKDASRPAAWIDADTREMAASYGLSEEELKDFSGAEEFRRFARIVDQKTLRGKPEPEKPVEKPVEKPAGAKTDTVSADEIDPEEYEKEGYDPSTLKLVRSHKALLDKTAKLEQALSAFQSQQVDAIEKQKARTFHEAVDELGADVFGKMFRENGTVSGEFNAKNEEAREKLFWSARKILDDTMARTGTAPPLKVVLQRAYQAEFAEELRKRDRAELQERLEKQSRARRPSPGRGRSLVSADEAGEVDEATRVANHPAIVKAWEKMNGEGS